MITIRRAGERGRTRLEWLDSQHTFAFGQYVDPDQAGFRSLVVLNDDRVAPGAGFPMHEHRDMEIVTYVLEGALEHEDSMENRSVLRAGQVQKMSAGTGVLHSEQNHSDTEPVHFLQIWILPRQRGIAPGYEERAFDAGDGFRLIGSPDGRDGSVTIHQDLFFYAARSATLPLAPGRGAWVHVAQGSAEINGHALEEGDGAAIEGEPEVRIEGDEVLVFDMA